MGLAVLWVLEFYWLRLRFQFDLWEGAEVSHSVLECDLQIHEG